MIKDAMQIFTKLQKLFPLILVAKANTNCKNVKFEQLLTEMT